MRGGSAADLRGLLSGGRVRRGRARHDPDRELARRPRGGHPSPAADLRAVHHRRVFHAGAPPASRRARRARSDELEVVQSHVHALGQCRTHHPRARRFGRGRGRYGGLGALRGGARRSEARRARPAAGRRDLRPRHPARRTSRTRITTPRASSSCRARRARAGGNGPVITSFIFRVRNVPAALYKALGGFATNGVNMTKLESYQLGGKFFATLFYADVEGHPEHHNLKLALEELEFFSAEFRIVGVYPASPFRANIAEPAANRDLRQTPARIAVVGREAPTHPLIIPSLPRRVAVCSCTARICLRSLQVAAGFVPVQPGGNGRPVGLQEVRKPLRIAKAALKFVEKFACGEAGARPWRRRLLPPGSIERLPPSTCRRQPPGPALHQLIVSVCRLQAGQLLDSARQIAHPGRGSALDEGVSYRPQSEQNRRFGCGLGSTERLGESAGPAVVVVVDRGLARGDHLVVGNHLLAVDHLTRLPVNLDLDAAADQPDRNRDSRLTRCARRRAGPPCGWSPCRSAV